MERHFRSGGIRALFSTSTLAMGLNLPVRNVILDGHRWLYLKRYGRWSLEEIAESEYENMSGRAGRLGLSRDFGRSILVTASPFEAKVWLKHFVDADFEEIVPTLKDAPLENHVVNLLASRTGQEPRDDPGPAPVELHRGHLLDPEDEPRRVRGRPRPGGPPLR